MTQLNDSDNVQKKFVKRGDGKPSVSVSVSDLYLLKVYTRSVSVKLFFCLD